MADSVSPGSTRPVSILNLPTGLVGTLGVRVENEANEVITPRTTAGIVEFATGNYRIDITFPDERGYVYVIADVSGVEASEAFFVTRNLPESPTGDVAWAPTVDEVAAYVRARTKVSGNIEVGTFTDKTRPTKEEVELLIEQAVDHVGGALGIEPCSEALQRDARRAAALYTAILIEVSYFPETSSNSGSSAVRLEALWKDRIKSLTAAVLDQCGTGDGTPKGGAAAAGSFDDGYPLIGRDYPPRW